MFEIYGTDLSPHVSFLLDREGDIAYCLRLEAANAWRLSERTCHVQSPDSHPSRCALRLTVDRLEGPRKEIAVLLTDSGQQIDFPRGLLPERLQEGDILHIDIRIDAGAARRAGDEIRKLQDTLGRSDTGGDLVL